VRAGLLLAALAVSAPAGAESPAVNYLLHCQGCHRPDGGGTPGAVPALAGFVGRFLGVAGGREFLVRVPGSSQSPLSDAELAELLSWIVRRFGPVEVAADFAPFTAEEVTRVRRPPLADVESVRRALVARMQASAPAED
jgi:mono/diheme cytochrome c family protein